MLVPTPHTQEGDGKETSKEGLSRLPHAVATRLFLNLCAFYMHTIMEAS